MNLGQHPSFKTLISLLAFQLGASDRDKQIDWLTFSVEPANLQVEADCFLHSIIDLNR